MVFFYVVAIATTLNTQYMNDTYNETIGMFFTMVAFGEILRKFKNEWVPND